MLVHTAKCACEGRGFTFARKIHRRNACPHSLAGNSGGPCSTFRIRLSPVRDHYFLSVVPPHVWELLFKTRGKFILGACPVCQQRCYSGNCTVETKLTLSYVFVPIVFITDKLIWDIDNKQDPYQDLILNSPDTNSVSHLILKYGLPDRLPAGAIQYSIICHLSHLSHLSLHLYRVQLSPGLRSASLFKTWKKSSWLVFPMWDSSFESLPLQSQGCLGKGHSLLLATTICPQSPSALVFYTVKLTLHCFSRYCLR